MAGGYNQLVSANRVKADRLREKVKFIVNAKRNKDLSDVRKAYQQMNQRRRMMRVGGVVGDEQLLKKKKVLRRLMDKSFD